MANARKGGAKYDYLLKLLLIGDSGKRFFLIRWILHNKLVFGILLVTSTLVSWYIRFNLCHVTCLRLILDIFVILLTIFHPFFINNFRCWQVMSLATILGR